MQYLRTHAHPDTNPFGSVFDDFRVDEDLIGMIVGKGGKNIKRAEAESGVPSTHDPIWHRTSFWCPYIQCCAHSPPHLGA